MPASGLPKNFYKRGLRVPEAAEGKQRSGLLDRLQIPRPSYALQPSEDPYQYALKPPIRRKSPITNLAAIESGRKSFSAPHCTPVLRRAYPLESPSRNMSRGLRPAGIRCRGNESEADGPFCGIAAASCDSDSLAGRNRQAGIGLARAQVRGRRDRRSASGGADRPTGHGGSVFVWTCRRTHPGSCTRGCMTTFQGSVRLSGQTDTSAPRAGTPCGLLAAWGRVVARAETRRPVAIGARRG